VPVPGIRDRIERRHSRALAERSSARGSELRRFHQQAVGRPAAPNYLATASTGLGLLPVQAQPAISHLPVSLCSANTMRAISCMAALFLFAVDRRHDDVAVISACDDPRRLAQRDRPVSVASAWAPACYVDNRTGQNYESSGLEGEMPASKQALGGRISCFAGPSRQRSCRSSVEENLVKIEVSRIPNHAPATIMLNH
jgi:hypothetical protein